MKLTKKYQIVYKENKLLSKLAEQITGTITYVGSGYESAEFDELEDAEKFISDNKLEYSES